MRDIQIPDAHFEMRVKCAKCKTQFVAEAPDLNLDGFKKPGTHWFDGSADAAGLDYIFFLDCPNPDCDRITHVETRQIPVTLGLRLLAEKGLRQTRFEFA